MRMLPLYATLALSLCCLCQAATTIGPASSESMTAAGSTSQPAVNRNGDGIAVSGYDVVAYFDQKQAMKGNPLITSSYQGAAYRFISEEHRVAFSKDPEHFIPQYGGFCAYGASQGHKAPADPEAWTVLDDKLYLNYNRQVQKTFLKDPSEKLKDADTNWKKLKQ